MFEKVAMDSGRVTRDSYNATQEAADAGGCIRVDNPDRTKGKQCPFPGDATRISAKETLSQAAIEQQRQIEHCVGLTRHSIATIAKLHAFMATPYRADTH